MERSNFSPKDVLIIVPTYNEAVNINPLLQGIFSVVPEVDVLFVDDNSQDGTVNEITKFKDKKPDKIHLIQREGKLGLGTAYLAGFKWALARHYEVIMEMDADLSHDPQYLPDILQKMKYHDAVFGSRYVPGGGTRNWPIRRKALSRFGSLYARIILGAPINDFTGGFNAWRRGVLKKINIDSIKSEGYSFQIELKYRTYLSGFSTQETPIVFVDRLRGKSKMSHRIVLEAMTKVWAFRRMKI